MNDDPGLALTFEELLEVTADAPGRPGVTDYGVPVAAAARIDARLVDTDVYHGAFVKAGALLDTLLRHPWLEHHQASAAWSAVSAQLAVNGWLLAPEVTGEQAAALMTRVAGPGVAVAELARELRALFSRPLQSPEG